jgi:predicted nucleic acid-binding protein
MRLFLDTSVLLAACGSPTGVSREVVRLAKLNGWVLITTPYVISEVQNNLGDFAPSASAKWTRLECDLIVMRDVFSLDRPSVLPPPRIARFSSAPWPGRMFC